PRGGRAMTASRSFCIAVFAAATTAGAVVIAQTSPAAHSVESTSPEAGSYTNGPTTLHANISPPTSVLSVTFSVDGRQQCIVRVWPYECQWDAGENIAEHQIRA